ncbi:MAG: U32 family peptidase [Paludibacter sp.]|nr:U32 family peptidase [Paludibacter sp.]
MGKLIELLSPAKNIEIGMAAINHGADAVYIGAPQFSARAAAGNSIQDIASLVKYAHQYRSEIFVAINTILTDAQLPQAERLIRQIYEAGADALIVQDMGILKLDLPPIELHASTQTDNRTIEKVKFLQDVGFSRVVLARELSLQQIKEISLNTDVELEAFVHGALCVSYSGQCYMSEAMSGRSANRGQCAQYCRLPYNLLDVDGRILVKNKHLLSLKDLDLSESVSEMLGAGITSFKIEGRLKDIGYVKNITAFYRRKIDAILEGKSEYQRASSGKTIFFFEPNPEKSFRRSATDYFLHGRHKGIIQPETPKSLGESVGKVTTVGSDFFRLEQGVELSNGDGLCFLNKSGELVGFRVNKVESGKIYPADRFLPEKNTFLYRNQDQAFERILRGKTAERRVGVNIVFSESMTGFQVKMISEDGSEVSLDFLSEKQTAQKVEVVENNIRNQFSKLGNTIYEAQNIDIQIRQPWFFPASRLAEWRREITDLLDAERAKSYSRKSRRLPIQASFPQKNLTYLGNVTNKLASGFYHEHGVEHIQPGFEAKALADVPLMFTRHCVKNEMGWCPREGHKPNFREPLYLTHKGSRFELIFDCKKCEMQILPAQKL